MQVLFLKIDKVWGGKS